jgi:hypothetical protein
MRFHFLCGYNEPHDRSAALAPHYFQTASYKLRTFVHSDKANTLMPGIRRKSLAVVFHFQANQIVLKS